MQARTQLGERELNGVGFDIDAGPSAALRALLIRQHELIEEGSLARRDAEAAEQRFRELIDALPAALYTTDARGKITHFNPACVAFSGRTPELGSDHWCVTWKLYYPDGRPMPHDQCPMAVALKTGKVIRGAEAVAERPDGTRIWFTPYPTPLFDDAGNVTGGINMLVDITERKRSEQALRDSEAELADFFDSAALGLHWVGPDGTILRVNQAELDMLGYTRDQYVGRHIAEFHVDRPVIDDILARLAGGEKLRDHPARLRRKDGTIRDVSITSSVLFKDGQFIHTRCFTHDVTDRKRLEGELEAHLMNQNLLREQAEAANVAKDNFIATLSHELRTPLTPVLATLGAWEREPRFPDALRDNLEMVRRNVDLEARLIDDLLDLTRIARGKLALQLEVLDVRKLLESVVGMYRSEIRAKKIELVLNADGERRFVRADPGRLQQAFWNLLKNAVKFTAEGGRIEVATRNDDGDGRVRIIVKDDGIGIAPEMLERLFTPFEQESVESIRRYGGLGLGLSITRKLLEAQGGTITAHSEGKYRGATFVIALPCVDAPADEPDFAAEDGNGKFRRARCFRVLLVEDHLDTARVLTRLLRGSGHEVTTAHSVADAISAVRADAFDVLVSDIGLPDGTGLDLIRQLRQEDGLNVPAVALTGFGMDEDVARCREAGFAAHLTKPVNLVKLEELIQRAGASAGAAGIECP